MGLAGTLDHSIRQKNRQPTPYYMHSINLLMFAMMLKYGKPATCTQYAEYFGQTKNFFNKGSSALAERVAKRQDAKRRQIG